MLLEALISKPKALPRAELDQHAQAYHLLPSRAFIAESMSFLALPSLTMLEMLSPGRLFD
jgi:hypothetical protein